MDSQNAKRQTKQDFQKDAMELIDLLKIDLPQTRLTDTVDKLKETPSVNIEQILKFIKDKGVLIDERLIRRYHLSLNNRGFLILSGISGTGKTWMAELYAQATKSQYEIIPVAPNWTSNEDLIGFQNPIDNQYNHTKFSVFLKRAEEEYKLSLEEGRQPQQFHMILDEMNLARVEYYFANFLSLLELRNRGNIPILSLSQTEEVALTPNLFFIGTINVDETTHGFSDKIYDRAQMIEMRIDRKEIEEALKDFEYAELILEIWETVNEFGPFAFRVIMDIKKYMNDAKELSINHNEAIDEQVLQKILPKIKGTDMQIETKLIELREIFKKNNLTLSLNKLDKMIERFNNYGIISFF